MNLLEEFADHLEFLGLGTVARGTEPGNIYWGRMPDQPDDCICVFSSDSGTPGQDHPARIQIITRSRTTRTAYELSQAIAEEIDDETGYLHGDGAYVRINAINTSQGIGTDAKQREMYTSNYYVRYCG